MWYVARKIAYLSILPLLVTGCSLRILGVDKSALTTESGIDGSISGSNTGINSFSVLGATGGSDTTADTYLTDGTSVTATWVDTSGEDSYEVKILDSTGSSTLCGPVTVPADSTSYTFTSCSLSHGATYRIQVTAKNSATNAAQSAYSNFQVGPFITMGDLTVNEWGVASIPVSLSYAVGSAVSVQYVTADVSAQGGSDYIHSPLSTLTIPAGQTSATISIPLLTDRSAESSEQFRVELSSASGAGLLSTSAQVTLQDDDLSPLSGLSQVAIGEYHACALTTAGGVKCWGRNNFGQSGSPPLTTKPLPSDITGLTSGVVQIAAGQSHTCALTTSGGVKCWGKNLNGQLGDNTNSDKFVPTDVFGLTSGVSQVAAGDRHTCAITTGGGVKCWGYNFFNQLGDNTLTDSSIPVDVIGLSSGAIQIALGSGHTCALTSAGGVKCWGLNNSGQIGDNTAINKDVPTDVPGLTSGISQISTTTYHTCALSTAGAIKCWGLNDKGQIGDNSLTNRAVPTDVPSLASGVSQVVAGGGLTCAITSTGSAKCWGANEYGQLGDNSVTNKSVPSDVSGLTTGTMQIGKGRYYNCALTTGGSVKCWGYNNFDQLGDNSGLSRRVPTDVSGISSGITQIKTGLYHSCGLTSAGAAKCWGYNNYGQLGDNSILEKSIPTDVTGLSSDITQISTGGYHSCALTSAGAVKCWGRNNYGQLGDNSNTIRSVPTDVSGLSSGVTQIDSGEGHTCALTSAGAVRCWGDNTYGQLGDNSFTGRLVPTDVFGLSTGVSQISTGAIHTCALLSTGAVKCWGNNMYGRLGDNSSTSRAIPTDVFGLTSGIVQIAAGGIQSCALTSAGGAKCWGYNANGAIGDNSTTDRWVPTDVFGLSSGISQIDTGNNHSCAITLAGALKCWGYNQLGQLGDTTNTNRTIPADVSGLSSGANQISAGNNHTCAIISGGSAKCWGNPFYGQVGDTYHSWVPQFVVSP